MKVLVVGTGGSIVSGISTAADEMVNSLREFGHSAERLNAGEKMRGRANALTAENVRAVLVDAVAVGRRARRGHADVVWLHTFGVPVLPALRALAMVVAARASGRPAVVHFHAFGLERFVAEGKRPLRLALRGIAALAGAQVVVHEAAAAALRDVNGGSPVEVVPNWVHTSEQNAALPPLPPLRLVFVGGLVRRKGVPELIEAIRMLEEESVELRLVGGAGEDGPEALERLQASAADLVAAGRVSFAGELGADGVRAELRAAHLFVLPSEAEGLPMSMLEAMAASRAVLVTDAGGMAKVVNETECGWILPDGAPHTIAECLRRILAGPAAPAALAERGGAAGRATAERYSSRARQAQIEAILCSVSKRARSGPRRNPADQQGEHCSGAPGRPLSQPGDGNGR